MDVREKERRRRRRRRSQDKVLHRKLRNLEQDWDSFKQTHPSATFRRWSVDHSNTKTTSSNTVSSPRSLVPSLQQYCRSPKAAIEMGKSGALLELEGGTEMGLGDREDRSSSVSCNYNGNYHDGDKNCADKEEEVVLGKNSSVFSDDEKMGREELVVIEREGIGGVGCWTSKSGRRWWMLFMGCFSVFLLMAIILGFISLRCTRAGFGDEDEVMLLPT